MLKIFEANPELLLTILSFSGQDFNGCLVNCSNNGQCLLNMNKKFVCECERHFVGESCLQDTRICSYSPCKNNATCTDITYPNKTTDFNCTCGSDLFYGTRCESVKNVCKNVTCSNQGICINLDNNPVCQCFKNFNGTYCEIKSAQIKLISRVATSASVVSISIMSLLLAAVIAFDYSSFVHPFLKALIKN